jgi:release factor glutamine methyltransferase
LPEAVPSVPAPPAVRDALAWGDEALAGAGCASPRLDAELLLAEALGFTRAQLVTGDRSEVGAPAWNRYLALIARRREREPVAYILGVKGFRRIVLNVDRRVLIPRPETELLVEVGLELPHGARVADVGTGSGAVALALKDERPDLDVLGIEISDDALDVARENAVRLGLEVTFARGDLIAGLDAGALDAVLANLPYVERGATLAPEIEQHEPAVALFGGEDGLDPIRRLIGMAGGIGLLALEIGNGRADAVSELLREAGFGEVTRLPDLAGIERVVVGRR